jgi:hypothetical protein
VPGTLKSWIRAADGRWIGIIDFSISDTDGGERHPRHRRTCLPLPKR